MAQLEEEKIILKKATEYFAKEGCEARLFPRAKSASLGAAYQRSVWTIAQYASFGSAFVRSYAKYSDGLMKAYPSTEVESGMGSLDTMIQTGQGLHSDGFESEDDNSLKSVGLLAVGSDVHNLNSFKDIWSQVSLLCSAESYYPF